MCLLVRKINRAKWENNNIVSLNKIKKIFIKVGIVKNDAYEDICADAITNCLKTNDNKLSVWKIKNNSELEDAILALITGPKQEKLSTLHYVLIDEKVIIDKGLSLIDSNGETVVQSLINKHRDINNLSYKKLGIVKSIILESIKNNNCSSFTKKQLKDLISKAINEGKLVKERLNEKLIKNEKL